jgi:hypothetical protein
LTRTWVWQTQSHGCSMIVRLKCLGLDPSDLGMTTMPNSSVVGLANHVRSKCLESDSHVWFDKQQTKKKIMHFSCQRKRKERKNTNNRSPATIQPLSIYARYTIWKRVWLHIQLDNGWPNLATMKCYTLLLNGADAFYSLMCKEHTPATFQLKITNTSWKY